MAIEGRWINFLLGLPKIHSIIWIVNILFRLYTMVHAIIYTNIYILLYIHYIIYYYIYYIIYCQWLVICHTYPTDKVLLNLLLSKHYPFNDFEVSIKKSIIPPSMSNLDRPPKLDGFCGYLNDLSWVHFCWCS